MSDFSDRILWDSDFCIKVHRCEIHNKHTKTSELLHIHITIMNKDSRIKNTQEIEGRAGTTVSEMRRLGSFVGVSRALGGFSCFSSFPFFFPDRAAAGGWDFENC